MYLHASIYYIHLIIVLLPTIVLCLRCLRFYYLLLSITITALPYVMEYGPGYKCFNIIGNGSTAVPGALKIKTFSYHFISIV